MIEPVETVVFDYDEAFLRNLGFIDSEEQRRIRSARVAVAGLGGTGGAQIQALARLGIGAFSLADPDTFELKNFNRQSGAFVHTIGRLKTEVASEVIHAINPEADVAVFDEGINESNIDAFLDGVTVVVDSLDFYCFKERFLLYGAARARNLWVITSPPLGFGFTMLTFNPTGMSFEDYFGFHAGMSDRDRVVALIAGIAPKPLMLGYLKRNGAKFESRQLPSVAAAPFMIAGAVCAEVANLIVRRVEPVCVPDVYQFDALLRTFRRRRFLWGMRSPLQRLRRVLLNRFLPA